MLSVDVSAVRVQREQQDNKQNWQHPFTTAQQFLLRSRTRLHLRCSPAEATEAGRCTHPHRRVSCAQTRLDAGRWMQDLARTGSGSSGCRESIRGCLQTQHIEEEKQLIITEMAGGGGASTPGWMRNNEDPCSEDFTQLTHRLLFLLAP
ncbi:unnamed protein product [Pleuronectes platessa]|uniref:Uncharacterized protein n=1 Tax=Pleuronectes platessa TaxID=8262 RepID=A0A9N7YIH0_PLEPL|nr:unnamed protein product [Pleuronectes platessa]